MNVDLGNVDIANVTRLWREDPHRLKQLVELSTLVWVWRFRLFTEVSRSCDVFDQDRFCAFSKKEWQP